MSEPKYVLFYGDTAPRLKREPADGEMFIWTKADGSRLTYKDGAWVALPEDQTT